ncbi:AEC family transporter [Marinobacterium sp. D7]|uniref:AEC family transporter n=1 Tax=Marinobacterium ramblicola TaxID=2849041 RepID=UPI001C2DC20C|nr:AEC family transporter [Marinobacterium ramblicola]MBV1789523.1 AEC family transporter [Marinobacterium ramblicola]
MLAVLSITAPIFILIAIGYAAVKTGLMSQEAIPGLGRYVLYFALPALMFSTISRMEFGVVIETNYLAVYGIGSLLSLLFGIGFHKLVLKNSLVESGVKGMGMSIPNSAFIGFPILLQVFDPPLTQAFAMAIMVENVFILPIALVIIEYGGRENGSSLLAIWKSVFSRVVRNPLIITICAGLLASALSLKLPETLNQSLDMLARTSAATALFVIGASLVGNQMRGNILSIGSVVTGKLLIHPLLIALVLWLWPPFDQRLELAVLLVAAMPMMSIFPIIGSNYGMRNICASILLVTTVLSFVTITLLLRIAT